MSIDNVMIYNWFDIEKALEMVRSFPWERKLKKAEYFSDACDMVKLFEAVNETVNHPCACDPWYAILSGQALGIAWGFSVMPFSGFQRPYTGFLRPPYIPPLLRVSGPCAASYGILRPFNSTGV